jgi:Domain of unknown function (DUF4265)
VSDSTGLRKVSAFPTKHGTRAESFWAEVVGPDAARITNIPFFTDAVAFGDVVRVDPGGKVLAVLERTTRTRRGTYPAAPDRRDAEREWAALCDYLRRHNVACESAVPGMFGMAVPPDISDERLAELLAQGPVELS